MNDKQEEERYDIIHDFIMNNDSGISTDQHYKDARDFLVYITKFYDTFSELRTEAFSYIKTNKIFNNEDRLEIMKKIIFTNSEYNTELSNIKQFYDNFLHEDRDEYSVVKLIFETYNYKKINISYPQIENIKDLLEFYLSGDIKTMSNGDENEIEYFNYLKQLSLLGKKKG
jgi:hypothetical protein